MTELTLIRHESTGNVISVYRGHRWLGLVYSPTEGSESTYTAAPWNAEPVRGILTEQAAIATLESSP